jgi:Mor family transcriptional regulator
MEEECIVEVHRASVKETDLKADQINGILIDRYHNNMKVNELRKKHKISQRTWTSINNKYSEKFIEKFGKKNKKTVSIDEMEAYWGNQT